MPLLRLLTVVAIAQLSLVLGADQVTVVAQELTAEVVMLLGHVAVGAMLSVTVTVNEQVDVLLWLSVAV